MEAGREMDALVAERVMGFKVQIVERKRDTFGTYKVKHYRVGNGFLAEYSTDIAAAWQVDKSDWYWVFSEMPNKLQITLYPSREAWDKRPFEMHPYPKESVHVDVRWDECKTKAEAYALGRCRAALLATEGE
jgi:hypothetical protein